MNAIFVTEKEAREFINTNFGASARIRGAAVTSDTSFDFDKVPYSWDGETEAYDVNDGEALVGFMEPKGAVYSVSFREHYAEFPSAYQARLSAAAIRDAAEDNNQSGEIIISCNDAAGFHGNVVEVIVVEGDDDTPEGEDTSLSANRDTRRRIGAAIHAARVDAKISIRDLADKSGISKNQICRIEAGRLNATIDTLNALAIALNLEINMD